ncbi:OTU domain-containing protein 7B [Trichinella murrelli]|uniref:ubiquitinyl hydrolase 1 n=1 Tax=Trichinella murrelli TaxID=144512 RepID=A0A0V0TBT5_9BILA|nr:OTU domain-containing protein 7B [Trichinella murrelli]
MRSRVHVAYGKIFCAVHFGHELLLNIGLVWWTDRQYHRQKYIPSEAASLALCYFGRVCADAGLFNFIFKHLDHMRCWPNCDTSSYTIFNQSTDNSVLHAANSACRTVDCPKEQVESEGQMVANGQSNNAFRTLGHVETPSYTFTLPDLSVFPDDFRNYLEKDLIETSSLKSLESSGHLNWWAAEGECQKLWPLATNGDGNCLLHAASLGMWGFHDRFLMLRKALHLLLTRGSRRHALRRRWRWQQTIENRQSGLVFSEEEWCREWDLIVQIASPMARTKKTLPNRYENDEKMNSYDIYESLESIHVFALAHVLKRPIVIVSDTVLRDISGEALSPIMFGGIYLPLECSPSECHRSPLVLCFDTAHFSALVAMQKKNPDKDIPAIIPITYPDRTLLPLHFASDPGPDFTWWKDHADVKIAKSAELTSDSQLELITRYMDVVKVPVKRRRSTGLVEPGLDCARKKCWPRSVVGNVLLDGSKEKLCKLRQRFKRRRTREFLLGAASGLVNADPSAALLLSTDEVRKAETIFGAQIGTSAHHQLMDEMINSYLKTAKLRFEQQRDGRPTSRRERFSGDLSNGRFTFSCINGACSQPASHETNFLCRQCFEMQTQILESFTAAAAAAAHQDHSDSNSASNNESSSSADRFQPNSCRIATNSKFYIDLSTSSTASCPSGGSSSPTACSEASSMLPAAPQSRLTVLHFDPKPPLDRRSSAELKYKVTRHVDSNGVTRYRVSEFGEQLFCNNRFCSRFCAGHTQPCGFCTITRM